MRIRKKIKFFLLNIISVGKIFIARRSEISKFKDKRRKSIYKKIKLTKEQKKEIDELYKNNYGHRIPYTWHRHYYAFTKQFDKNYFPELLYIPEFENFMNLEKSYCKVFEDKNVLPIIAKDIGVKMPYCFVSCSARNV